MHFIFMLTKADRTVRDAVDVLAAVRPLGLQHIGFKDVGVGFTTLRDLADSIRAAGAQSYLEVVSTSAETAINSARVGAEIGVDHLLGGTQVDAVLSVTKGSATRYYPFPGHPFDHPTRLAGLPAAIEAHCREFIDKGCAGADLLAYRATEAPPLELVAAARRGLGYGRLIIAGGIGGADQIGAVAAHGADAFTIGTAAFNGSYAPDRGMLDSQLRAIMADCGALTHSANAVPA